MSERDADAITRLPHAYADTVLERDEAAWGALWTEDGRWDLGPGRVIVGREAIVDHWWTSIDAYRRVVQLCLSSTATIEGDETRRLVRPIFVELNVPVEGDRRILVAGYHDAYRRTADGWRFAGRALSRPYAGAPDLSGTFFGPELD